MEKNKQTLLKGDGLHQHTLYGDFVQTSDGEFGRFAVKENSVLRHETPFGEPAEHKALYVSNGKWSMGKQVEFNPFDQRISAIWD